MDHQKWIEGSKEYIGHDVPLMFMRSQDFIWLVLTLNKGKEQFVNVGEIKNTIKNNYETIIILDVRKIFERTYYVVIPKESI